jgi:hypothetical protein
MTQDKPLFLYKYEAFSTQSLENLKNQVLYFGSPVGFNDPYDCTISPPVKIPNDAEIEAVLEGMLQRDTNPERPSLELSKMSLDQKREMLVRVTNDVLEMSVNNFKKRGVICFSEKKDNLLMWSHYGGRYKGFCLEFSTAFEPFQKIGKVKCRTELPTFELSQFSAKDSKVMETLLCTKSADWSYEAEWRAFHREAGTTYGYPAECLTGVYFGPEMNLGSIEIICLIFRGQNPGVKFWRGSKSPTEFKVLFEQFTYTSFVETKKLGQR